MNLRKKTSILLLLIFAVGIYVRFLGLGKESLWCDEFFSLQLSREGAADIINLVAENDAHPPLYYLLLHLWTRISGESEWDLRSFSAFIGVLTVVLVFLTARSLAGDSVSLISSLVFALAPFHVYYSQEARMYALLVFVTVGCIFFAAKILDSTTWYVWLGLLIFEIATLYTHYYGLFVIATLNIYMTYLIFIRHENVEILKSWIVVQIAVLILYGPWIPILIKQIEAGGASPYAYATSYTSLGRLGYALLAFFSKGVPWCQLNQILLFLIALGILFGICTLKKTEKEYVLSIEKEKRHLLLIAFSLIPMFLVFLTGQFMRIYSQRSLIISLVPFCMLLGFGISKFRVRSQTIILAAYILVTSVSIYNLYQYPQKEQWREAATYINHNAQAEDIVVVCTGFMKNVFNHYSGAQIVSIGVEHSLSGKELRDYIDPILMQYQRIWLVLSHTHGSPIKEYLLAEKKQTTLLEHNTLKGIDISLIRLGRLE